MLKYNTGQHCRKLNFLKADQFKNQEQFNAKKCRGWTKYYEYLAPYYITTAKPQPRKKKNSHKNLNHPIKSISLRIILALIELIKVLF